MTQNKQAPVSVPLCNNCGHRARSHYDAGCTKCDCPGYPMSPAPQPQKPETQEPEAPWCKLCGVTRGSGRCMHTPDNPSRCQHQTVFPPCNFCFQTMIEALQAIMARAQGIYDSPALLRYGPLMPHRDDDIVRIAREALARVREARKP